MTREEKIALLKQDDEKRLAKDMTREEKIALLQKSTPSTTAEQAFDVEEYAQEGVSFAPDIGKTVIDELVGLVKGVGKGAGRVGTKIGTGNILPTIDDVVDGAPNTLPKAWETGVGIFEALANPEQTMKGLYDTVTDEDKLANALTETADLKSRAQQGDFLGLGLDFVPGGTARGIGKTASKVTSPVRKVGGGIAKEAVNIGLGTEGGAKTIFDQIKDIAKNPDRHKIMAETVAGKGDLNLLKKRLDGHMRDKNIEINDGYGERLDGIIAQKGDMPVDVDGITNDIIKDLESSFDLEVRPSSKTVTYSQGTMKMPRTEQGTVTVQRPSRNVTEQSVSEVQSPGARLTRQETSTGQAMRRGRPTDVNVNRTVETQGAPRTRQVTTETQRQVDSAPQEINVTRQIIEEANRPDRVVQLPNGLEVEFKNFDSLVQGDKAAASLIVNELDLLRKSPGTLTDINRTLKKIKSITEAPEIGSASRGDKMLATTIDKISKHIREASPELRQLDADHQVLRDNFDNLQRDFSLSGKADANTIWKKLAEPFKADGITTNAKVELLKQLDSELGGQLLPMILGEMTRPALAKAAPSKTLQLGAAAGGLGVSAFTGGLPVIGAAMVSLLPLMSPATIRNAAILLGRVEGSKFLQMAQQAGKIGGKALGGSALGLGAVDRFNERGGDILTNIGRIQR